MKIEELSRRLGDAAGDRSGKSVITFTFIFHNKAIISLNIHRL